MPRKEGASRQRKVNQSRLSTALEEERKWKEKLLMDDLKKSMERRVKDLSIHWENTIEDVMLEWDKHIATFPKEHLEMGVEEYIEMRNAQLEDKSEETDAEMPEIHPPGEGKENKNSGGTLRTEARTNKPAKTAFSVASLIPPAFTPHMGPPKPMRKALSGEFSATGRPVDLSSINTWRGEAQDKSVLKGKRGRGRGSQHTAM